MSSQRQKAYELGHEQGYADGYRAGSKEAVNEVVQLLCKASLDAEIGRITSGIVATIWSKANLPFLDHGKQFSREVEK